MDPRMEMFPLGRVWEVLATPPPPGVLVLAAFSGSPTTPTRDLFWVTREGEDLRVKPLDGATSTYSVTRSRLEMWLREVGEVGYVVRVDPGPGVEIQPADPTQRYLDQASGRVVRWVRDQGWEDMLSGAPMNPETAILVGWPLEREGVVIVEGEAPAVDVENDGVVAVENDGDEDEDPD